MTTPIPEAAVEAAAEGMYNEWRERNPGSLTWETDADWRKNEFRRAALSALTAARPLMEAEDKADVWDECLRAIAWAEVKAAKAGDAYEYVRANNPYRAATIAERTQR